MKIKSPVDILLDIGRLLQRSEVLSNHPFKRNTDEHLCGNETTEMK